MSNEMTLITNISFVSLQSIDPPMRLEANALLIRPTDTDSIGKKFPELCGFGEDSTTTIFSLPLETTDFELVDAQDPSKVFLSHDGSMRPLFMGGLLKIGKHTLFLQFEDYKKPIKIEKFIPPMKSDFKESEDFSNAHSTFYENLWATLQVRVAEFWHAPYFPTKKYMPVELVRLAFAGQSVLDKMSRHDLIRALRAIEVIRKRDEATIHEIESAMLGLQSTDEPALQGFYEDLEKMKKSKKENPLPQERE